MNFMKDTKKDTNISPDILGVVIKELPVAMIDNNEGQVDGVPENPRKITAGNFKKLCDSIRKSPELKELNEIVVYPHDGRYVALSGNHRLKAYKALKWRNALCKVLPEDTPREKLREIVIKENMMYAQDDAKALSGWDMKELAAWDVPMKLRQQTMTDERGEVEFTEVLDESHNYVVLYFDNEVDWLQAQTVLGIKQVRCLSTAKDRINQNGHKFGVGRVLRGVDVIGRLLGESGLGAKSGGNNDENIG